MRAIDRQEYHSQALTHLEALKVHDSMRIGYYSDMANKWNIESRLANWINDIHSNNHAPLDLANLDLVSLYYEQYFCVADEVNLKNNELQVTKVHKQLDTLRRCNVQLITDDITGDSL